MSVKGDFSKLRNIGKVLPKVIAQRVAARTAPDLSARARAAFLAGESPYGDPWTPAKDGRPVTLRKTGRLFNALRFVSIGTITRAVLAVPYLKYHIGTRQVLPPGGRKMPIAWSTAIAEFAHEEIGRQLKRAA